MSQALLSEVLGLILPQTREPGFVQGILGRKICKRVSTGKLAPPTRRFMVTTLAKKKASKASEAVDSSESSETICGDANSTYMPRNSGVKNQNNGA